MQTYIWVCLILFLAGFTQGLSGFGAILMSLPLLSIFLDIKTVIPLVALAAQAITLIILIQLRQHLDWKKILPLVISAFPGILVGVYFLERMDKEVIHWILGVTLIIYSLYGLFLKANKSGIREGWAYLFGFLGGCLGGALSAAGPPVIVYTSLCLWGKDQIKATLQGYFVLSGLVVIMAHAITGLTTPTALRFFGIGLPILFLGTCVGTRFYGLIKEAAYRKIMLILLSGMGVLMIYRA
ncbi:sulfite exporter TauE/SafE family protein [Thermodesulfobacteriota bacterium]